MALSRKAKSVRPQLDRAVARLPGRYREVIAMHYLARLRKRGLIEIVGGTRAGWYRRR